ncbi:transmembrane emp24 domain-containing protein p24beta2-like [Senna tora]|uniref:Transmembrane emp24 domain-containing protein p24beta2-like n=1 Tax=Senna tora TaxID=362788 RepID=A0A834WVN3_9FABA|nr:transmembrane emp24 domain-containing protein p24beta2-like [Senna tora]
MLPVDGCKDDGIVGTPRNRTTFDRGKPYNACRASVPAGCMVPPPQIHPGLHSSALLRKSSRSQEFCNLVQCRLHQRRDWKTADPLQDVVHAFGEMELWCWGFLRHVFVFMLIGVLCNLKGSEGIRFVIDREECFSHDVKYEGDTVHVSFVVIKSDSIWRFGGEGVDLVVTGPSGDQIQDFRDKTAEKFEFVVRKSGVHKFCFTNKSPSHETVDFDVHEDHFSYFEQHAKDGEKIFAEHLNPLLEEIAKLDQALYSIQFEQHWLEAQTDRQAIVNEALSRRAVHKAIFESAALIGTSALQVYLLRRLFERRLGTSRV